jgi:oxygen-independent coproporphyrinogen-3 oxidase
VTAARGPRETPGPREAAGAASVTGRRASADVPGPREAPDPWEAAGGGWGAYVHVPFCASRCRYCDFDTQAGMDGAMAPYFEALGREIEAYWSRDPAPPPAETVFFGGGTPSHAPAALVCGAMARIPKLAPGPGRERTIEANPGTLAPGQLEAYREAGFDRLSMGLQSADAGLLRMLGRAHTFGDCAANVKAARAAGFRDVSLDLMFGLPGQGMAQWEDTLARALSLGPTHVSCYSLSLEEGTPLAAAVAAGALPWPDEGLDREMCHAAAEALARAGLAQYEISNFAVPGHECRHNLKYWTGAPYRGFGAGAHSYDGASRFWNVSGAAEYIERRGGGAGAGRLCDAARAGSEPIDAAEREKEHMILGLRLTRGVGSERYRARFGAPLMERRGAALRRLEAEGLVRLETGPGGAGRRVRAALTPLGMDLANRVFREFL